MRFQQAANKSMDRIGTGRVRRRAWREMGWTLTILALQGEIYWSHRSPFCPWIPKWDDLDASDWEPVAKARKP